MNIQTDAITSQHTDEILALVGETFDMHVAPLFSQAGIEEFYKVLDKDLFMKRIFEGENRCFAARDAHNDRILGVLEIRNINHIMLFFVRDEYQGKGIGSKLVHHAVEKYWKPRGVREITVNASPNAVPAYEKLGFTATAPEQEKNGIVFVSMKKIL